MDDKLALPARFDSAAVPAVMDALLQHRNHPVKLDADKVSFAGALGIQLLVAATRQWRNDNVPFRVVAPGPALLEACQVLGVRLSEIGVVAETEQVA